MEVNQLVDTAGSFAPSKYGKHDVLIIAQHEYNWKNYRNRDNTTVWECRRCKVKAETKDGIIVKAENHNHLPDANATEKRAVKTALRTAGQTPSQTATKTVVAKLLQVCLIVFIFSYRFIQNVGEDCLSQLNTASLARSLRNTRQKNRQEPPIPIDNSFELSDDFKKLPNGDPFLVHDNKKPNNRILVFSADWALDLLEESYHWGIFKTFFIYYLFRLTAHSKLFQKLLFSFGQCTH